MPLQLKTSCLLFLFVLQVFSETLLERLDEELRHPRRHHHIKGFNYGTDAIAGPRSVSEVGTFRGQPIISRQDIGFVDNEGVPMGFLGSSSKDQPSENRPRRHRSSLS